MSGIAQPGYKHSVQDLSGLGYKILAPDLAWTPKTRVQDYSPNVQLARSEQAGLACDIALSPIYMYLV